MKKPYRQIILHAGLPKTGSTSIQNNCYQHRNVLLQNGIVYPSFNLGERRLLNHSDPLTAVVFDTPNERQWAYRQGVMDSQKEAKTEFSRQFSQVLSEPAGDRLLLSAEIVANYSNRDLKKLRKYLEKYTDDLRVLIFLRSPQSSVESILQQQAYGGGVADNIRGAVVAVRERFEVLYRQFGDRLEVLDFHASLDEPGGLVGVFLRALSIEDDVVSKLSFSSSNERVSMEAYKLMVAINERFPVESKGEGGYRRRFHDLQPLTTLPGAPFRLDQFKSTDWYKAVLREEASLSKKYGFQFPEIVEKEAAAQWQDETLLALENVVSRLESAELRGAAAQCLEAESAVVADSQTASILVFVSQRVRAIGDESVPSLLESIGADYFKFAALQVGPEAPGLALKLMSLAQTLRPEAEFIAERVKHYRGKLQNP
jgi:hypothetical protein